MVDLLRWLSKSDLADHLRATPHLYPKRENVHINGLAVLIGPAPAFDLRLLGLGRGLLAVTTAARSLLPCHASGCVITATTSVLMFIPNTDFLTERGSAPGKLGLVVMAGINIALFHPGVYRTVQDWDLRKPTPFAARAAGVFSGFTWTAVTIAGRLLAFM